MRQSRDSSPCRGGQQATGQNCCVQEERVPRNRWQAARRTSASQVLCPFWRLVGPTLNSPLPKKKKATRARDQERPNMDRKNISGGRGCGNLRKPSPKKTTRSQRVAVQWEVVASLLGSREVCGLVEHLHVNTDRVPLVRCFGRSGGVDPPQIVRHCLIKEEINNSVGQPDFVDHRSCVDLQMMVVVWCLLITIALAPEPRLHPCPNCCLFSFRQLCVQSVKC